MSYFSSAIDQVEEWSDEEDLEMFSMIDQIDWENNVCWDADHIFEGSKAKDSGKKKRGYLKLDFEDHADMEAKVALWPLTVEAQIISEKVG